MVWRKIVALLIFNVLLQTQSFSQNASVSGQLIDSSSGMFLRNGSVVLLQPKDSFIVSDIRTDSAGKFLFARLNDTAQYVLFFTYPQYADYAARIDMRQSVNGILDLRKINMILKARLLENVVVKSTVSAIKLKGDTTEYTADSFRVQPNANVEELLKQLPGIQIDQYGNITAQGKKVKKVLVDGEEFFGDDPTLVTRNLRADIIDKVQLYDKKSDAAAFTGIEDGIKDKTINLKIKEDKNHGTFGKLDAGGGTDDHYNLQGMFNLFKGKRKMSLYATSGNIGRTGLGSADKERIGSDEDGDGTFSGKGLPKTVSAGTHFDNKWNDDKETINGNYKFGTADVKGDDSTVTQNNLPSAILVRRFNSHFENKSTTQKANIQYIHKFDTTSTLKIYSDGSTYHNQSSNLTEAENEDGKNNLLNSTQSSNSSSYDLNVYNVNLSWEKKLKKYRRTIAFYLNNNFSNDKTNGENLSNSTFYNLDNRQDSTALLHLNKQMQDDWHTINLSVLYTEPLSPKISMVANYNLTKDIVHENKNAYNLAVANQPTTIDSSFSTKMDVSKWGNQGSLSFNYTGKKTVIKIGNNLTLVHLDIESIYDRTNYKKDFVNWNPQASMQYNPSQYKEFNFSYNGYNSNPDRSELLPNKYNNSQLTTFIPNTDLKSSFTNNFSGNFSIIKLFSQTYYNVAASYGNTSNPITLSTNVNDIGTYVYRYVNMNGYTNSTMSLDAAYSRKINPLDLQASISTSINNNKLYSRINDSLNTLNNNTYSVSIILYKTKLKKYEFYLLGQGGYTKNKASLQPNIKNNYFYYSLNPSADIYILKKFQLHTDANYLWQQKSQAFTDNFHRTIWNAWLGRTFLKNDQLIVRVSCNDILNQNNGYERSAYNTYFSENRYTTIRRFFMVGVVWSFTKFNSIKQ